MKKLLFFFLFSTVYLICFAQQHISYTQYTLNQFALNPAVAGIKPCAVTTLGNRSQWAGFEGAPRSYFANFHRRLNIKDKYPKNYHGLGGMVTSEKTGFNTDINVKIAYAYHIKLWRNYHASMGIFAGVNQLKTNYSEINLPNLNIDPAFDNQEENTLYFPEISPGGFLYGKKFYLGLSILQIYPIEKGRLGTSENKSTAHYFFMGAYRFAGKKWGATPSFLTNFSPFISPTVDLTLTVDYQNKISVALGSKYLNSGYAILQLNLGTPIKIGYSYEYALTELANVAPSTHEIILQISNCSKDKDGKKFFCPAYQ